MWDITNKKPPLLRLMKRKKSEPTHCTIKNSHHHSKKIWNRKRKQRQDYWVPSMRREGLLGWALIPNRHPNSGHGLTRSTDTKTTTIIRTQDFEDSNNINNGRTLHDNSAKYTIYLIYLIYYSRNSAFFLLKPLVPDDGYPFWCVKI